MKYRLNNVLLLLEDKTDIFSDRVALGIKTALGWKEFTYKGKIYQIDESSKTNINGKISAILLSQNTEKPIESVNWIAKDNSITEFSTAEFLAFSQAIASYIEIILFKNDQIRTAINNAKSIQALNKIVLSLGE